MITSGYIIVNGIKIYIETNNGPKAKGTVVCFGSAGRESRQFHGIMDALANDFEVMAFDMPGHGKSWPLLNNELYDEYKAYCGFILEVLDSLNIKHPIYLGCALGGNVAYYLARNRHTRAIVTLAGTDYSPNVAQAVIASLDHPYCNVQHSHLDFTNSLIGSCASSADREFILWGVHTEIGKAKVADYGGVYNGFDIRADMDKITCPVLAIRGAEDWTVKDAAFNSVISRLQNAKHVKTMTIPKLAHYGPQENPRLISEIMAEFVNEYAKL